MNKLLKRTFVEHFQVMNILDQMKEKGKKIFKKFVGYEVSYNPGSDYKSYHSGCFELFTEKID